MVFNLKKIKISQNEVMDEMTMNSYSLPPGVNPIAAQYLWNNVYKDDPNMGTIKDMVDTLGGAEGIDKAYEQWANPEQVADAIQPATEMEDASQNLQNVLQETQMFNLKIAKRKKNAQEKEIPMDPMGLNDYPELMGDQFEEQQNIMSIPQPPFTRIEDFRRWMDNTPVSQVQQAVTDQNGDHLKEAVEQYMTADDEGVKGKIAADMFADPLFPLKEESGIMATQKRFEEVTNIIKKMAEKTAKENKPSTFNMKKIAQHKTIENTIMWGPGQTRIDPFLHQPVSDWHIVERNKGFGLVVDDVWNIDYETIWRENIMDKYSRPYRDNDGNWVGGYIQKRFEVDKNIPETSNMQLKPGQLRRPIVPEYGNTEARLQAARAAGKIEGANDKTKPFNWKEAKKKKLTKVSQMGRSIDKGLPEYNGIKPFKLPGDPDPAKPKTTCQWCGSNLNEDEKVCHNCGQTNIFKGQPNERKVPDKGESPSPFGTNVDRFVSVASRKNKEHKKNHDIAEEDPGKVNEVFVSDPISQCLKPKRINRRNDDISKEEIMRSCEDLAIDG